MRPKSVILLMVAGGCGIVASIAISQVLERRGDVPPPVETQSIYVALHNINLGDPIDASMVSLQEWPQDRVPAGAIAHLEDLEGRRPRAAIIEGEPVLEGKLLAPGQMADPISQIPPEMRLVTVNVDAETSAAGLLNPGDRVDIQLFVKRDPRNGIDAAKTKIILQNIRVYAIDQAVQRSADGSDERAIAKTISLLLTPKQAGKVNLAEKIGEISLIPRNPDDESTTDFEEVTLAELWGNSSKSSREKEQQRDDQDDGESPGGLLQAVEQSIPEPPANPPWIMEVVLADQVTEMLFDPETGRPIRQPDSEQSRTLRPGGRSIGGAARSTPSSPHKTYPDPDDNADTEQQELDLKDFPVDLEDLE